jgi:hypothetical protein
MDPVIFPETFEGLDDAALATLRAAALAEGSALVSAETFSTESADRADVLDAGIARIDAELAVRAEADAALAARLATQKAKFAAPAAPAAEDDVLEGVIVEPAAVVAAAGKASRTITVPSAAAVVANAPAAVLPKGGNPERAIIAGAGVPGFRGGDVITMKDIVAPMLNRFATYQGVTFAQDVLFQMRFAPVAAEFQATKQTMQEVLDKVVDQSRLVNAETGETGLIAAGGWCAPTPQEYDICVLAGLDGELDLPTMGMPRGSLSYFRHLPYDVVAAQLAAGIGCYTQAELEAEPPLVKPCVEIDCPTPVTAELDACSLCIRAGIIQMKGFPEYVAAWMDLAMIAWARFVNARKINELIAAITADAGAPIVIPATFGSISALLSAIRLAVVDLRAFHGMTQDRTFEVVLPYWVHDVLAVDKSRRQFNSEDDYTEAEFRADLAEVGVRPQFIKDWVGQDGGFGGAVPATVWPSTVQFMLYPAGAYVWAREEIITVSTLQDTALLQTNRTQLLFVEYASKVIPACGSGRIYEVTLCPNGTTGGPLVGTGSNACPIA